MDLGDDGGVSRPIVVVAVVAVLVSVVGAGGCGSAGIAGVGFRAVTSRRLVGIGHACRLGDGIERQVKHREAQAQPGADLDPSG